MGIYTFFLETGTVFELLTMNSSNQEVFDSVINGQIDK